MQRWLGAILMLAGVLGAGGCGLFAALGPDGSAEPTPASAAASKDPGATTSKLAGLDHKALVEVALADLLGEGNAVGIDKKPVTKLRYEDQVYLAQKLYVPIIEDKDKLRTLQKAACAWQLYRSKTPWDNGLGDAIEAGKCKPEFQLREVYTVPLLGSAFAAMLLEGHPKKDEGVNQVRLREARMIGGEAHGICYRTEQRPEPTPGVDVPCTEIWRKSDWDGARWVMSVMTYAFAPKPPEELRLRQLDDMEFLLGQVEAGSPSGAEARALAEQVKAARAARTERREASLKALRAKTPALVGVDDLPVEKADYLYHRTCGEPKLGTRTEGNRTVTATFLCVTVASEDDEGCEERDFVYKKPLGATKFTMDAPAAADGRPIDCP